MAIDFTKPICNKVTRATDFGIIDIPPVELDFTNVDKWNLWVDNKNGIEVRFTSIDKCIEIPRSEGKRCEAMLSYSDTIIFIELKEREGAGWAGEAREQLINTIKIFKREHGISGFTKLYGQISNKKRPQFYAGGMSFYEYFEMETGFILKVSTHLKIQ